MRKKGKKWFGLLIAIVFLCAFCVPVAAASKLPKLQVKGTQLVNSSGKKVQLRGISTHGLSWYPEYVYFYEEKLEGKCSASCHVYC